MSDREILPSQWRLAQSGDLDGLARRISDEFHAAEQYAARTVIHTARTGALLQAAKAQLEGGYGYGSWGVWCEANLPFSPRTAQLYMQIASAVPALADPDADVDEVLSESPVARELAGLPLRQIMRRLAEPRPHRPLPAASVPSAQPEAEVVRSTQRTSDPREVLYQWVRSWLPLASTDVQTEVLEAYVARHADSTPDPNMFEDWCVAFNLGQRSRRRR